jgi:hypothetical protein
MPRMGAAVMTALGLCLLAACDSSNQAPTSPSAGLQVTAVRAVLRAAETAPLTVTGGSPSTPVTWTTSDATVVTVSPAGLATAGRPGRAIVSATSGSSSGSLALRVVPDYGGTWTGGVVRLQLTCAPGSAAPICAPGAPTAGTLTLRVTQTGDQLSGTLADSAEPAAVVPLTGQVQADDQLALAGRVDVGGSAPALRVEAGTLRASSDVVAGLLSGSYALIVERARTGTALQDDYRAQVQFRDLRRP